MLALLGLVVVGNLPGNDSQGGASSAVSSSKSSQDANSVTVPSLVDVRYMTGVDRLREAGLESDSRDGSPRGRSIVDSSNWTVIASSPKPGTKVARGSTVMLTVLKNDEVAWFKAHPTMPKVSSSDPYELTSTGPLKGMDDLVEYLYPQGKAPDYASDPFSLDDVTKGTPMLPAELAQVKGLKMGSSTGDVVGSFPQPGQPVRMGRLLYVLTVDKPTETSPVTPSDPDLPDPNLPNPDLPGHRPHLPKHHWGGKWWK